MDDKMTMDEFMIAIEKFLAEQDIQHVGTDHDNPGAYTHTGSGRHHYGSGENPYQRSFDFMNEIKKYKAMGYDDKAIADVMGYSQSEFRKQRSAASNDVKFYNYSEFKKMYESGTYTNRTEIANKLGVSASTIDNFVKKYEAGQEEHQSALTATRDLLMEELAKYSNEPVAMIDVGEQTERYMGTTQTTKNNALKLLENDGYIVKSIQVAQVSNSKNKTTVQLLCKVNDEKALRDAVGKETDEDLALDRAVARYAYANLDSIKPISDCLVKAEGTYQTQKFQTPVSVDWSRVKIGYADDPDDGTANLAKDGTMLLRRSCADLTMTDASSNNFVHYGQVRIAVGGTHYCKGMALYGDDDKFPPGVDIIFYTNKTSSKTPQEVLKKMKKDADGNIDKDNPFGAELKTKTGYGSGTEGAKGQRYYLDENGNRKLSAVNILKEEGDWNEYKKNLSAQFLSKQSLELVENRLGAKVNELKSQYDEINKIENPTVRKKFLEDFAEQCDSDAVHLNAAAFSGQLTQVLLPVPSMRTHKDASGHDVADEVYAPNFPNGHKIALIRFPHAGTFEIPVLTVNNNNPDAKAMLGRCQDAVGLPKAALDQLSGADTDGDTVVCIDVTNLRSQGLDITSEAYWDELREFEPKADAPFVSGVTVIAKDYTGGFKENGQPKSSEGSTMTKKERGQQMGLCTNLIMDMTLLTGDKAPTHDEMVRAVKYSMIVIDAYKHGLDWRTASEELNMKELYTKYASTSRGGGTTLITRASGSARVENVNEYAYVTGSDGKTTRMSIDPNTGEKLYSKTGETYVDRKTGETKVSTTEITKLERAWMEGKDATSLLSSFGNDKETAYATFANTLHAMGNEARKQIVNTEDQAKPSTALVQQYSAEIASLNEKIKVAQMNSPKERLAQAYASAAVKAKLEANPAIKDDADALKKVKNYALNNARARTGADGKGTRIQITSKEYEAINAGAVGTTALAKILAKADKETLTSMALGDSGGAITEAQKAAVLARWRPDDETGPTQQMIADQMGISVSSVNKIIAGLI